MRQSVAADVWAITRISNSRKGEHVFSVGHGLPGSKYLNADWTVLIDNIADTAWIADNPDSGSVIYNAFYVLRTGSG